MINLSADEKQKSPPPPPLVFYNIAPRRSTFPIALPPPPPPPTFHSQTRHCLHTQLDERGFIKIPNAVYVLLANVSLHRVQWGGTISLPLLEYADLVHQWCNDKNELLNALAGTLMPRLKELAYASNSMDVTRFHSERLVLMLGKQSHFKSENTRGGGRLQRAYRENLAGEIWYTFNFEGLSPLEVCVNQRNLLDGTFEIEECVEDREEGGIELKEDWDL